LKDPADANLKDLGVGTLEDRKRLLAIASIGAAILPPVSSTTSPLSTDTERQQITVLFRDLVSSMALANRLDAEDLRDVIRTYHKFCTEIVTKFDGSVAQYLGDVVTVRFGFPKAHADDAERAAAFSI
jgi:class 3 adenylate cyclase